MIEAKLSLVLPAHNEQANLAYVIEHAVDEIPQFFRTFEVIIVNDGSYDRTGEIADLLARQCPSITVVHHGRNRGYGSALRSGFAASSGDWVMVMDSDRQFDLGDLVYLAPFIGEYDLVAGYRMRRSDPIHRVVFGKIFKVAVGVMFGLRLRDIDCAFKVIRGDLLRRIELTSPGALVSTELMAKWVRVGGTWTEVGVNHYPRSAGEQSGGSFRVIFRAMKEIIVLRYRLDREPAETTRYGSAGYPRGVSIGRVGLLAGIAALVTGIGGRLLRSNRKK